MSRFVLSFMGYSDGYTDAVSMTIAGSCNTDFAQKLAVWMTHCYFIGVVFMQWVVMSIMVQFDPSQACLMKLLHMDALAASVSIPKEKKWMWSYVNAARTHPSSSAPSGRPGRAGPISGGPASSSQSNSASSEEVAQAQAASLIVFQGTKGHCGCHREMGRSKKMPRGRSAKTSRRPFCRLCSSSTSGRTTS